MKYLIHIIMAIIGLCILLLENQTRDLNKEILGLKKETAVLRNSIELCDDRTDKKVQQMIDEVGDMFRPFTHIIHVNVGFLGVREEKP